GNYTVNLYPESGSPTVDMYFANIFGDSKFLNYTQTDVYGGYLGTVTTPATSPYVIAVGALTSKPLDTITSKSFIDLGKIAYFSSRGPTRDGRIKPDITAPGYFVLSAWSGSTGYREDKGTSMASPVVAGIVAQLLEVNSNLDVFQVKDILSKTALSDSYTLTLPNYTYGYGKVSITPSTFNLFPAASSSNPQTTSASSGGGGGCSMLQYTDLTFILLSLLTVITLRKLNRRFA
ncbi:MAG: S8 family serine peptidase, partial [Sulfurihydrogenibium sp.]|uniref:S8 family serine peptidase n=1 Tax=Sulfurihydrogenibium sp. TaxID=2053621 RepID=UPI003D0F3CA5